MLASTAADGKTVTRTVGKVSSGGRARVATRGELLRMRSRSFGERIDGLYEEAAKSNRLQRELWL